MLIGRPCVDSLLRSVVEGLDTLHLVVAACGPGTLNETVRCAATEETVHAAIRQIGKIFNVPTVAEQLVSEIKEDFDIAERAVAQVEGTEIKAVWLDCVGCCKDDDGNYITDQVFVGAGGGAPTFMKESGITNVFESETGSWNCVDISELVKKKPDIVVVVDASWDSAIEKIKFMHKHAMLCKETFIQKEAIRREANTSRFPSVHPRSALAMARLLLIWHRQPFAWYWRRRDGL